MKKLVQKKDWDYSIYNVNGKKSYVWFFVIVRWNYSRKGHYREGFALYLYGLRIEIKSRRCGFMQKFRYQTVSPFLEW